MIRSAKRRLAVLASASLLAAGLSAAATTAAQATMTQAAVTQAGPFWPGNLLSMSNADFENGAGKWSAISNATLTTSTDAFLHQHSLEIGTAAAGTSVIRLTGASGITIPVDGGDEYRVGAYIKMPAGSGQAAEFDLSCYGSAGMISWRDGKPVSYNGSGTWQWMEDDITLPAACTYVQDSPRVQFTGVPADSSSYMDEAWFAPERAALMIGAYAPKYQAWNTDNTNIGPLQSDKIFFGGKNSPKLPATWASTTNQCYELEHGTTHPPVCVINLSPPDTPGPPVYSEAQIRTFLTGMPGDQTVIMVYRGEAELGTFANCPGSGPGNAANFRCYFKQEANDIRAAAEDPRVNRVRNVFLADDSASSQYDAGGDAHGCNWIVSPSYVDVYLLDHYERNWANGTPLSEQTGSAQGQQQWSTWLGCVEKTGNGKPIGLAEYGLCSSGPTCNNSATGCMAEGSSAADTSTLIADNSYLATEPSGAPTLLWNYWYAHCWAFKDAGGIAKWQSFESQNGGAVSG